MELRILEDFRRTLHDLAEKSFGNNIPCEKDEMAKKNFSALIKRDSLEGRCEPPKSEKDFEGFLCILLLPHLPCPCD